MLWLGICLAVVASMTGTAGKQCFRFSQLQTEKGTRPALFTAKVSLACGYLLNIIVGPLVDMGSYAFAPQSVIAPLGGLDVVWNTLSAPCTLGERLTPSLVWGCVLISGGATGTSFFGSKEDKAFDIEKLRDTLFRWAVLVYMLVLLAWLAFNMVVLIPRSAAPRGEPFKTGDKWRGLSLGMTAGSIAGNMFCVKAFVEIVQASIRESTGAYWLDWLPYALFLGALFFASSNLYFLTQAMREYEALFMGAVFEGTLICAACVSGVVVFSELEALQAWQVVIYWMAVLGVILGIITVAFGCMNAPDDAEDAEKAPEDVFGVEAPQPRESFQEAAADLPSPRPSVQSVLPRRSQRSTSTGCPFREVPHVVNEITKVRRSLRGASALSPTTEGATDTSLPPLTAWQETLK
uniref:Magnesium transporter n=1 Tax=Alexandrium catenella TaxID=2925 RepID=A0A7S1W3Q0_ALECA|mmetsp:Transcript_37757/g.102175  ORF Transcript_37757/g.102175 Transcript_37757/m.102175 type:complete len:407 (+) Transcript_37757:1-1221(+)